MLQDVLLVQELVQELAQEHVQGLAPEHVRVLAQVAADVQAVLDVQGLARGHVREAAVADALLHAQAGAQMLAQDAAADALTVALKAAREHAWADAKAVAPQNVQAVLEHVQGLASTLAQQVAVEIAAVLATMLAVETVQLFAQRTVRQVVQLLALVRVATDVLELAKAGAQMVVQDAEAGVLTFALKVAQERACTIAQADARDVLVHAQALVYFLVPILVKVLAPEVVLEDAKELAQIRLNTPTQLSSNKENI